MAAGVREPVWNAEGTQKRAAVRRLFAEIAPHYDRMNGVMSLSLHRRWRKLAVDMLQLRPGDRAIDLCCGTGDFLAPLRSALGRGTLLGIDFCPEMVRLATRKTGEPVVLGDACRIPARSESVDAVTVGWGIRNVADIDAAHREIARVLKVGGRFVSIDMAKPRNPIVRWASGLICHTALPLLGRCFGTPEAYAYLPRSTDRFLTREELGESMRRAGFVEVRTRDLFFGNICIHFGLKGGSR